MNALVRRVSTHHLVYNHFRIYCVFILDTSQWEFFRRPRQMKQNNLKRQNKSGDPGEGRAKNAPATRCDYIKHQPNKLWPHWKGGDGREGSGGCNNVEYMNEWLNEWVFPLLFAALVARKGLPFCSEGGYGYSYGSNSISGCGCGCCGCGCWCWCCSCLGPHARNNWAVNPLRS